MFQLYCFNVLFNALDCTWTRFLFKSYSATHREYFLLCYCVGWVSWQPSDRLNLNPLFWLNYFVQTSTLSKLIIVAKCFFLGKYVHAFLFQEQLEDVSLCVKWNRLSVGYSGQRSAISNLFHSTELDFYSICNSLLNSTDGNNAFTWL